MKRFLIPFALVSILAVSGCSQPAIGFGYVIGAKVALYAENNNKSKIAAYLKRNTRIEILAREIKDPVFGARRFWYKIRNGSQVGFISYDEEVMKNNLVTFRPVSGAEFGMVTASALRLRPTPSTGVPKIGLMERHSIVQILGKGSVKEKIEDKYDIWYRVKTSSGKIGYSFAGFILLGPKDKLKGMAHNKHRKMTGWFRIGTGNPRFLSSPGGAKLTKGDPGPCGPQSLENLPKQNDYVPITARQTAGKKFFYLLESYGEEDFACESSLNAWVSGKEGQVITNIFEHTKAALSPDIPAGVVAILRSETKDILNAKSINMSTMDIRRPESEQIFYHVTALRVPGAKFSGMGYESSRRVSLLISQKGETYSNLGEFPEGDIKDIDGDGRLEVFLTRGQRAFDSLSVYTQTDKGFKEVLRLGEEGSHTTRKGPYFILESNGEKLEDAPFRKKYLGRSRRILKFEKGKFHEVGRM